jgi:hypothetical protein
MSHSHLVLADQMQAPLLRHPHPFQLLVHHVQWLLGLQHKHVGALAQPLDLRFLNVLGRVLLAGDVIQLPVHR